MENLITIKNAYNTLDLLLNFLKKTTSFKCSKEYDIWEQRTDANGQMKQCIVIKKSAMHAIKIFFVNENTVKINYVIPNKLMETYFGESVKAHRNIIEIIAGVIKQALLKGAQRKAFEELEIIVKKVAV
jgi:hypothetical protein